MSLFASFLGNAANAGAEYLGNEIKNENQMKRDEALEKMREELLIKRTETIEAMKRSRDLKAGQDISAEADIIGKARIDKDVQSKMAADPELNGMKPGDQEALDKATPKQLKEVGLMDTYSRASRQDDVATAATKLGYKEEAQLARGQQQIENARDANERMILANEKRNEHDMRRDENADKRATNADTYNNKHLEEIIRHNKALEGAARERSGAEKLSPAAKVQLEIASSRVGSAQKEESLAATALNIISKEGQMADPVKLKEAKDAYGDAKKNVTNAFDLYNKTGKAHLGDSWKELETTQPEKKDGLDKDLAKMISEREAAKKSKAATEKRTEATASSMNDAPTGVISTSKNPSTGKTVYTVDGVRGRFNTQAEAEEAKRKSGIGKSSMSGMIDRYGD